MNYKYWLLLIGLVGLIMLSGCSAEAEDNGVSVNEESETQEYDPNLPEAVNDGVVDLDFYNELMKLMEFGDYIYDTEYMSKIDKMYTNSPNREVLEEYRSRIEEFDVFLEGLYFSPTNEVENEVYGHASSFIRHNKIRNSYLRDYTKDLDNMYRSLASDEHDEASISLEALINAMDKNELFVDKE